MNRTPAAGDVPESLSAYSPAGEKAPFVHQMMLWANERRLSAKADAAVGIRRNECQGIQILAKDVKRGLAADTWIWSGTV
jgi:hypothetical protein